MQDPFRLFKCVSSRGFDACENPCGYSSNMIGEVKDTLEYKRHMQDCIRLYLDTIL